MGTPHDTNWGYLAILEIFGDLGELGSLRRPIREAMSFAPFVPPPRPVLAGDLTMIRTALVAAVVAALVAGGWGCSQSPGGLAAKGKTPAARLAQLEDELAALKAAQHRLAENAAATAESLKLEKAKTAGLVRERDGLRADLAARASERDAARAKLDGFRLELKELLARVEGVAPSPSPSALGSAGF